MKRQFVSFAVADLELGIEAERVQEIIRGRSTTPVPLAPEGVTGLINLRGQIVPVVDLRRRLCTSAAAGSPAGMNVVVRSTDGPVSLEVDGVGDVLEIGGHERLAALPPTIGGIDRRLVRGVFTRPEGLLLVLDVDRALEWHPDAGAATHRS